MRISCAQFDPAYRDVKGNLEQMRAFVRRSESDLIIFPELAQTGYFFKSSDEFASLVEPIDGPIARALSALAKEEKKAIISGFLEQADGKFYNSALAFDANGTLM